MNRLIVSTLLFISVIPGADGQDAPYDFHIHVMPQERRIAIQGTWSVPKDALEYQGPPGLYRITFLLSPKMTELMVRQCAPSCRDGEPLPPECVADGGDRECRMLLRVADAEQRVLLEFRYRSDGTSAPQFSVEQKRAFAGGGGELWYPQLAFAKRDTGRFTFRVPGDWVVISNGTRTEVRTAHGRERTFSFRSLAPVKFGFAAAPYHELHEGSFDLYLLKDRPNAQEYLRQCARVLHALTSFFGEFPYRRFALVEVDFKSKVLGTSEYGFILADRSQFESFNVVYWAHEIAHQWWGVLVKSRSGVPGQMMFSEGVAQFAALATVNDLEGGGTAAKFRSVGLLNSAQSVRGYIALAKEKKDLPLATHLPRSQDEILLMHRLANSKGMMVLWMLANQLGRERFMDILKNFLEQYRQNQTSWVEFQQFISHASEPADLQWFFKQWMEQTGLPELGLKWRRQSDGIDITIDQCSTPYRLDNFPIRITLAGGKTEWHSASLAATQHSHFHFSVPDEVEGVDLDPEQQFLWMSGGLAGTGECHPAPAPSP